MRSSRENDFDNDTVFDRLTYSREQKIDALGTRLASIEQFFKSNATSSIEDDSSSDLYHGFASTTRPSSRESTFCGDTSIIAHSNFAHDYLEKELENRGLADRIPGLIESLRSLKSEIDRPEHREPSAPHSMFDTSKPITSQITLPSFEFVQKIITLSQGRFAQNIRLVTLVLWQ